jgi:hypothetical protein
MTFLTARYRIEAGDAPCSRFGREDIGPCGFHIAAKRRDKAKSGYNNATHALFSIVSIFPFMGIAGGNANGFPANRKAVLIQNRNGCTQQREISYWQ